MPLCVPGQGQRGNGHIDYHKYNQAVEKYGACVLGDFLNQPGQGRIDNLQPDHGGDSPEKTVQQVDTSTQIKSKAAVIPEYGAEDRFRKYAADVFVGTA